jgi:glycosyltransferase involved in cell wall biosynthesis
MHFLFLSWRGLPHPDAGGSELMVDRIATALGDLGHTVTLACGGPTGSNPYATYDLGGRYDQYFRAPVVYHRRLHGSDVVVDVANGIPFFSPVWQHRPTICLVTHVHRDQWALHFSAPVAKLGWFLERRAVPRVYGRHRFAAISASTADDIERLGVNRRSIDVLHLGIDQPARCWPCSPEPLFVAVGRLMPQKRIPLLLEAWEQVHPVVGGRLVVIGGGRALESLRARAGAGVEFTGPVSDEERERWLGGAWLLVHAAQHEGWGMVIMEAAVAGTPSIAFDVPGVRDSVADGTTGVLVASLSEFVAQWIALAQDHSRRTALGVAARRRAAEYTWGATAERLVEIATASVGDGR